MKTPVNTLSEFINEYSKFLDTLELNPKLHSVNTVFNETNKQMAHVWSLDTNNMTEEDLLVLEDLYDKLGFFIAKTKQNSINNMLN